MYFKANLRQFQPFENLIKENQAAMFLIRLIEINRMPKAFYEA